MPEKRRFDRDPRRRRCMVHGDGTYPAIRVLQLRDERSHCTQYGNRQRHREHLTDLRNSQSLEAVGLAANTGRILNLLDLKGRVNNLGFWCPRRRRNVKTVSQNLL